MAQLSGFTEAVVAALRAQVDPGSQREVLLDQLPNLEIPTLIIWGESDRVFPVSQIREAVACLQEGSLEIIPDCGHLPHVERPDHFVAAFSRFLGQKASTVSVQPSAGRAKNSRLLHEQPSVGGATERRWKECSPVRIRQKPTAER